MQAAYVVTVVYLYLSYGCVQQNEALRKLAEEIEALKAQLAKQRDRSQVHVHTHRVAQKITPNV